MAFKKRAIAIRASNTFVVLSVVVGCLGTAKLTNLRTCSAPWTLPKLLILCSSADRFRPQNPRILLNLTVPPRLKGPQEGIDAQAGLQYIGPVQKGVLYD